MSQTFLHKRNKLTACLLVLLFVGPMLAAYSLYFFREHFHFNTTEAGELFSPPIPSQALPFFNTSYLGKWHIVYISDDDKNLEIKAMLDKIHLALGKEKNRVKYQRIFSHLAPKELTTGSIAIIDPQGWLILQYAPASDPKGILRDMRHLLRHSHAG